MYVGPGFQLPAHRNAVAVLALALNKPMRVALNAINIEEGFKICKSALIEPNELHLIETSSEDYAFVYLDALSHDLATIRARCVQKQGGLSFDLDVQNEVVALLAAMPRNVDSWPITASKLSSLLGFVQSEPEPRIASVVNALLSCPDDARNAGDWAQEVGLSSSRFQHLFKENVGIPFRRFRLWARMRIALSHTMRGASLTNAALEAGLSSSAHLSAAFKDMFGISPSQLGKASPIYIET